MRRLEMSAPLICVGALLSTLMFIEGAIAETNQVRIGYGYGIHYVPLDVMAEQKLIEKHAAKAGIDDLTVSLLRIGGGNIGNDTLLSGSVDFAVAGLGPMLQIWDRTKGSQDVRGIAAIVSMPSTLNSNRPEIRSLSDLTKKDRIAVPGVRVSIQAVLLQMAAKQIHGDPFYFDPWTVTMKHPDGAAAMMSGDSFISAHFTVPPYSSMELRNKSVHTVATSFDITGGKHTALILYNTRKFKEENPKVFKAVYDGLAEAIDIVNRDKMAAAAQYMKSSNSKEQLKDVQELYKDPNLIFTTTPQNIMTFATFLNEIGTLKNKPTSWKDLFWETVYELPGS